MADQARHPYRGLTRPPGAPADKGRRWAKVLGLSDGYDLLTQSLEEESRTDELLTKIADAEANAKASKVHKEG